MPELSTRELQHFLSVARAAAQLESRDPEVVAGAADLAVYKLDDLLDTISEDRAAREAWVRTTARNEARRTGAKLHRDIPFGRQGSLPPKVGDGVTDAFIETLIDEMHRDHVSLGSLVAAKVDFQRAWALLSDEARLLLYAKYVEGRSTKDIAGALGRTPGAVDMALTRAKAAARPLLQDLHDVIVG